MASAEKEKYGREGEEKKNECEGAPSSLPTTAGARRKMAPLLFFLAKPRMRRNREKKTKWVGAQFIIFSRKRGIK